MKTATHSKSYEATVGRFNNANALHSASSNGIFNSNGKPDECFKVPANFSSCGCSILWDICFCWLNNNNETMNKKQEHNTNFLISTKSKDKRVHKEQLFASGVQQRNVNVCFASAESFIDIYARNSIEFDYKKLCSSNSFDERVSRSIKKVFSSSNEHVSFSPCQSKFTVINRRSVKITFFWGFVFFCCCCRRINQAACRMRNL